MRLCHTLHKICVFRSKTLCLPLCVTFKGKTWHAFSSKIFIQYEQKISPIVGKIGIPFRHLIAKWESNHQMGVGAQPDQSLIKSRKCMHKKSTIVKIYTILAFSIDENISNINKLSTNKSLNIKTNYD